MSIKSVQSLDSFNLRIHEFQQELFAFNTNLLSGLDMSHITMIKNIKDKIQSTFTAIESDFAKIVSEQPSVSSGAGSTSFLATKHFFEVVTEQSNKLIGKIDLLRQLLLIDPFNREEVGSCASTSEEIAALTPEVHNSSCAVTEMFQIPPYLSEENASSDFLNPPPIEGHSEVIPLPEMGLSPCLLAAAAQAENLVGPFSLEDSDSIEEVGVPKLVERVTSSQEESPKRKREPVLADPRPLRFPSSSGHEPLQLSNDMLVSRIAKFLEQIPDNERQLTPEEREIFQSVFGSDEYIRFTELVEQHEITWHSSHRIDRKVRSCLRRIG